MSNVQWCASTGVNGTKARGNWIVPPQGQKVKKEKWSVGEQRKQESKDVEEEKRGRETVAGVKSLQLSERFDLSQSCDFECLFATNRLL